MRLPKTESKTAYLLNSGMLGIFKKDFYAPLSASMQTKTAYSQNDGE
jgi:hypothetical protein